MAVIYLDGNSFGNIQRNLDRKGLQKFDDYVKECRKCFLRHLLNNILFTPSRWMTKNDNGKDCIRLEILLWGGDEILLVVPAWLGWWTLSCFFRKSKDWKFESHSLTHAAGLVFCHHRAPIHGIQEIAKELAELAKGKSREANYVGYQILESFDTVGMGLEEYREKRLGKMLEGKSQEWIKETIKELIIPGNEMEEALVYMAPIKRALSKGRVYKIVQTLFSSPEQFEKLKDAADTQLNAIANNDAYQKLQSCFGKDKMFWIHLIDLWDYIGEPTKEEELCF